MKHEWRKNEKQFYLPKAKPVLVSIPKFKFFVIEGKGNPNDAFFSEYVEVLYALSYGIKMSPKKGVIPQGYYDYTVYPLEGVWDLAEEARASFNGTVNKNDLVFTLMIRQPDFTDSGFAHQIIEQTKKKKPRELLEKVRFEEIAEGDCVQMLHLGSYDDEAASFNIMERFAADNGYRRKSKIHKEIYLSDPRNVAPEQLKTVLRFGVEKM